mgnify:CR=1 FL=1
MSISAKDISVERIFTSYSHKNGRPSIFVGFEKTYPLRLPIRIGRR